MSRILEIRCACCFDFFPEDDMVEIDGTGPCCEECVDDLFMESEILSDDY